MVKNDLKNLDEYDYFKKKVTILKEKNKDLLFKCISVFPEAKRNYFVNILTVEKVDDAPRKIYKIKK